MSKWFGKKSKIVSIIVFAVVIYKYRKEILSGTVSAFKFSKKVSKDIKDDIKDKLSNFSWSNLIENEKTEPAEVEGK